MKKIIKSIFKYIENLNNYFIVKKYNIILLTSLKNINGVLKVFNAGKFIISKKVRINSKYSANPIGGQTFSSFFIKKNGILFIGENSKISNSTIVCWKKITIKNNVFIGGGCRIYDSDFHSIHYQDRNQIEDNNINVKEVIINNNVFIGAFSLILKGVIIGENSVIGAGSVISKSIPPNEIWAGNPAIKIKNLDNRGVPN
jgi:acetyltransferase-like isoleucine patch superfamily enzyme